MILRGVFVPFVSVLCSLRSLCSFVIWVFCNFRFNKLGLPQFAFLSCWFIVINLNNALHVGNPSILLDSSFEI